LANIKKGFVYIMTNPAMPGLIKVGMSSRVPEFRAKDEDLNATGVPGKYKVRYYAFFGDMYLAEKKAHQKLQPYHYSKEFFKVDVSTAINAIESIDMEFTRLHSEAMFREEEYRAHVKIQMELIPKQEPKTQPLYLRKKQDDQQKRVDAMKERDQRLEKQAEQRTRRRERIKSFENQWQINQTSSASLPEETSRSNIEGMNTDSLRQGRHALEDLKKYSSSENFDQNTYAKVKPVFQWILTEYVATGKALGELFQFARENFNNGAKPYFIKFCREKREEKNIPRFLTIEAKLNDPKAYWGDEQIT